MVHIPWRNDYIYYKSIKYKKIQMQHTVLILLYDVPSEDSINHEI
jgi:hypothetical protein